MKACRPSQAVFGSDGKTDVDFIDGLSLPYSIDQKTTSHNPRSTVGTVTEIYDYLRLLYARVGVPHCPECGREIKQQTVVKWSTISWNCPKHTDSDTGAGNKGRKGEYLKVFEDARKSGFVRIRVDGSIYDLSEEIKLNKNKKHDIEVVVDRLIKKRDLAAGDGFYRNRAESLRRPCHSRLMETGKELLFSQNYACEFCGISIEAPTPRTFSLITHTERVLNAPASALFRTSTPILSFR